MLKATSAIGICLMVYHFHLKAKLRLYTYSYHVRLTKDIDYKKNCLKFNLLDSYDKFFCLGQSLNDSYICYMAGTVGCLYLL